MPSNTATLFTTKNLLATLAVASVLLLSTGCAPELGAFGGGSTGGSGTGTSNSDGSGNTDPNGDNKGDNDGDDSTNIIPTGSACLVGNWIADNEGIQNFMESASGGASVKTSGHVIVTYHADGTAQNNYDHWTNTIKLAGVTSVVERHGVDKGTYTADDKTLSASDTSIGSVTTMTATSPSGPFSMTIDPEPSVFSNGKYTCSGDLLTLTVQGFDLKMFREH